MRENKFSGNSISLSAPVTMALTTSTSTVAVRSTKAELNQILYTLIQFQIVVSEDNYETILSDCNPNVCLISRQTKILTPLLTASGRQEELSLSTLMNPWTMIMMALLPAPLLEA